MINTQKKLKKPINKRVLGIFNPRIEKKRNAEKLLFATILLLLKKDFRHHTAPFRGFLFSQRYKF
ncbi:hypothetical protein, partial [Chryseobacterium gambrini]|uniref:hypothetical protein n=1 Tax=Chryseobacterium gambrini TaxID=373672 RepID=UPI001E65B65F